jgi:hypothetical protein
VTRFDGQEYLDAYMAKGTYPAIHTPIVRLVRDHFSGTRILDLCSSTGLLAAQLAERFTVFAIEGNADAIARGVEAGTYSGVVYRQKRLAPDAIPWLAEFIREHRIQGVVARRALPELDDAGISPGHLGVVLHNAGAFELFIEGRVESARSTHRLSSVERELLELRRAGWYQSKRDGARALVVDVKGATE